MFENDELAISKDDQLLTLSCGSLFIEVDNKGQVQKVVDIMKDYIFKYRLGLLNIYDTRALMEKGNQSFENTYSISVGLCITINFFFLILVRSMTTRQHSKQTAILRSLGASKAAIIRVAVYESLAVILTGATLGIGMNLFTSWIVGEHQYFLSGTPPSSLPPASLLILIPILAVVSGCLSAAIPQYSLLSEKVVDLLR